MARVRAAIAVLAAGSALALGSLVAAEAPGALVPTAGAAQAVYCPPGELRRRVQAYKTYTKQMPKARARYYRFVGNRRKRAAFVRKQKAQQQALLRAILRCD